MVAGMYMLEKRQGRKEATAVGRRRGEVPCFFFFIFSTTNPVTPHCFNQSSLNRRISRRISRHHRRRLRLLLAPPPPPRRRPRPLAPAAGRRPVARLGCPTAVGGGEGGHGGGQIEQATKPAEWVEAAALLCTCMLCLV